MPATDCPGRQITAKSVVGAGGLRGRYTTPAFLKALQRCGHEGDSHAATDQANDGLGRAGLRTTLIEPRLGTDADELIVESRSGAARDLDERLIREIFQVDQLFGGQRMRLRKNHHQRLPPDDLHLQ